MLNSKRFASNVVLLKSKWQMESVSVKLDFKTTKMVDESPPLMFSSPLPTSTMFPSTTSLVVPMIRHDIDFGGLVMSFSDRIIQLKNERKLLQKDIASSIGLSLRAYQYYEKGQKEPTLSVLLRLADYFDVSLDYLVGLSDTPERH